jgi:hypothetical protein
VENVQSQLSIVRSGFDELKSLLGPTAAKGCGASRKPPSELGGEQLTEHGPDANAGVEVAVAARSVPFPLIVPINRTIEGQFHEAGEGEWPTNCYLGA